MEEDILEKKYKKAMKVLNETSLPLFVEDTFEDILLAYKNELERLQKEFEAVDHECSRLEQKEIILEKENERYKDLIYALETYYSITEEDLEKCVKEDR